MLCRWRHLDLGGQRCYLVAAIRRVKCPDCGVRVEAVPWARGARFTRDFEDVVAFLAQQMAKAPIARLMRIAWDTVGRIVERVIAERLDPRRLDGLRMVGVDEVSYRRRHRYLTVVADHQTGRIVWLAKGRNAATLQAFFDELGARMATIRAVSIDMSSGYEGDPRQHNGRGLLRPVPRRACRRRRRRPGPPRRVERPRPLAHDHRPLGQEHALALLKAPDRQSLDQLGTLGEVYARNQRLYRAFLLYHQLRLLYALEDPSLAPAHLDGWLRWAARSKLAPFVKAARTLRAHRAGVLAAIRLGLSNGRLEGLNSRVRLISHRSFGFHSAAPLIALIYLCCGGIDTDLPLR